MNVVLIMFNSLKIKRLTSKMRKLLLVEKDYNKTIECANEILELDENNLFAFKSLLLLLIMKGVDSKFFSYTIIIFK